MEDFLKEKFNELEANFQDDWNVFEQKLERALFFKRMRIGAALAIFLIATSIGIFGTSSLIGLGADDEAPFGFLTEEGYHSSGSHSQWKTQPAQARHVPLGKASEDPENLMATQSDLPLDGSSKTAPALASSSPAFGDSKSKVVASSNASYQIEKSAGITSASRPAGVTEVDNAKRTDLRQGSVTHTSGQEKFENANTQQSDASASSIQSSATASKEIMKGHTRALGHDDTPARPEEDEKNTSPLNLNVPALTAMGDVDLGAASQVRTPPPAFKAGAFPKGPYISPLQQKSIWEYSIKVYPNFTFRKFKVDEDKANLIHRDFIDQVRVSESGGFSLNIGFEVSRKVGKATYINSGLEYISYKTEANFDFTNFRTANINEQTGTITSYSVREEPEQITFSDKNTYHYLNVPLSIAYKPWASDHVRLNIEAGVSYMYFVTARGKSIDYQTLEIIDLSDRDFRNHMGSMQLKVGATYYISPQFNLGFEPTFVYFTNTIYSEDYPFEVIPYSVGLNLKLQVKLN